MDRLVLAVPSRDGSAQLRGLLFWQEVAHRLGVPLHLIIGEGSNIPRARNEVLRAVRQDPALGAAARWVLWWDTDIVPLPDQVPAALQGIQWALDHGPLALVADYAQADGLPTIHTRDESGHMRLWSGPMGLGSYPRVAGGGLGCAWVWEDPTYVYHADTVGEDLHWFEDHADLPIYAWTGLVPVHVKSTRLAGPWVWPPATIPVAQEG